MKIAFNGIRYLVLKPTNHNSHCISNSTERAQVVGRCHNYATAEWMLNGIKDGSVDAQYEYIRCPQTNRITGSKHVTVKAGFFRTVRA